MFKPPVFSLAERCPGRFSGRVLRALSRAIAFAALAPCLFLAALTCSAEGSGASSPGRAEAQAATVPAAAFTFDIASPVSGQVVTFTDTSTGTPTGWSWSFGDGSTSALQNPGHAYAAAGTFTVTLTATNAGGSNAASRTLTVRVYAPAFTMAQSISDGAQRTTLAFAGLAMITGNLEAQSFFPPGKVADYTGFQYLRDNDIDGMGHNTSFLTRVAYNVIYVLDDGQFAQLEALAASQIDQINQYGYRRFPLMKAFRRLFDGDVPAGSSGLNLDAVKTASRGLYVLDGQISFDRALLYANIFASMDASQKDYLDAMKGVGWKSWPDIAEEQVSERMRGLPQGTAVAVMTYAGDLFSWYAGSVDADVYFCPERHGTYFGSFYIKDAPAIGHEGYSIDEQLTATAGSALCDSSKGYVTQEQATVMSSLVATQKDNLYASTTSNIVMIRTQIATLLRDLLVSTASADAIEAQVLALSEVYGELDGENNYNYANVFAQVYQTLTSGQKDSLATLRKTIMSGTYSDGTPFDFSVCTTPFLYSSVIGDVSLLGPYIDDTDYLFFAETAPTASFTFSPGEPEAGQAVTFSDTSAGGPSSWTWSFGDGATSSLQNPSHTYSTEGAYTVSLTVANDLGSSNTTQNLTVAVSQGIFSLTSEAGEDGGSLPAEYTCDGAGSSPALLWSNPPAGTVEFAVVMTTVPVDGPTKWSWVLYGIPEEVTSLAKNSSGVGTLGVSNRGTLAYEPPCSQGPGAKLYTFTVYALSASPTLAVPAGQVTGEVLAAAISSITLGSASLDLSYSRPGSAVSGPDFNKDGKSDILWRNSSTGEVYAWFMDGASHTGGMPLGTVSDQSWRVAGAGDFSGDGKTDILWRNYATGENYVWYMDGAARTGGGYLDPVADTSWEIAGAGDFNADGKPDVLWRNCSTGVNYVWFMDGVAKTGGAPLDAVADLDWEISATADFTGDGKADVLWRNASTGQAYIWTMDGTAKTGGADLGVVPTAWDIAYAADANNDGRADVLWRNSATGENYAWYMDGVSPAGGSPLEPVADQAWRMWDTAAMTSDPQPPSDYTPSDFDGDGKADVLWRNSSTGDLYVWTMDGVSKKGDGALVGSVADASWQVSGMADFNSDGNTDILWRNASSGENYVWYMDGLAQDGGVPLETVADMSWKIVGTGDFNGDGWPDVLWRNYTTGDNYVWYMSGVTRAGGEYLDPEADLDCKVAAAADFTGDGMPDVLWRDASTGQAYIWTMDGASRTGSADLGTLSVEWEICWAADYNSDGNADILWRNYSTGENYVWFIAGSANTGGAAMVPVSDAGWRIMAGTR